jgi:hydroxyacylglutathione hydrolase
MKRLAAEVHLLRGWPPDAINVYLVEDVLIDAATRLGEKRIMRQIGEREVGAHALTHVHPAHQGASHEICARLGIPLWCGQGDIPAMETRGGVSTSHAPGWLNRTRARHWAGSPHPVARALKEGDEVAGFAVLDTPGHTRGHVAFWRESDRVLILGDVLSNVHALRDIPGLHEPLFSADPGRNRESARKLAALEPALACFAHGAPLRDPRKLANFVARLAG